MVEVIRVEPVEGGWALRQATVDNPQLFASGAKAEDAARRLADRLARAGSDAEIRIFLRDGSLAGRFLCPAA
ncbi:MAG TPA: hypothetical protein VG939_04820 [Caulobacteraceae bacterium]|nr:hypothetical protein [Caulobacteraceae bacterium]